MPDLSKVLEKLLMRNPFIVNGYEYQFIEVNHDKLQDQYNIVVNVTLPKKGQSYVMQMFKGEANKIINRISKYIDIKLEWNVEIMIDGKIPEFKIYITPSKKKEILNSLNQEIKNVKLKSNNKILEFSIYFRDNKYRFYEIENVELCFYFDIKISNFKLDGKSVRPNLDMIDELAAVINELIWDEDSFNSLVDDIISNVMQDEIDINNDSHLYQHPFFNIIQIDGIDVHPRLAHFGIEDEMFT